MVCALLEVTVPKNFSTARTLQNKSPNQISTAMSKPLTATIAIAAAGILGYAVYFDYNRRNSPAFRKALKKRSIQVEKEDAKAKTEARKNIEASIKKALFADLVVNPPPSEPSKKETYFLEHVGLGEKFAALPGKKLEAALCFYKALTVYPNPTDVISVYKNSVPEDVYELITTMIAIQSPTTVSKTVNAATKAAASGASAENVAYAAEEAAEGSPDASKPAQADLD